MKNKLIAIMLLLSGCSVYPNKFSCPNAKGTGCIMLNQVDGMITSGQIQEIYRNKNTIDKPELASETIRSDIYVK